MKTLAALLAAVSMSGCVVHFPHGRDDANGHSRGGRTIVVCVFASCRDIFKPKQQQETPTPPASATTPKRADPRASRLDPGTRRAGIGP